MKPSRPVVMTPGFSAYLDFIRFAAALVVCVYHFRLNLFSGGSFGWFTYGNDAVVAFFVLSGLVIGFVADEREKTFLEFTSRRLARLWSVLPAAVLLSIGLEFLGRKLGGNASVYQPFMSLVETVRNGAFSVAFLNYSWGDMLRVGKQGVLWSIACEWWYYVGFALILFLRRRVALAGLAVVALLAGPNVFLLAPIWGVGFVAYRLLRSGRGRLPGPALLLIFAVSSVAILWWVGLKVHERLSVTSFHGFELQKSDGFFPDLVLGTMIATQIWAAGTLCRTSEFCERAFGWFSWAKRPAGISFTLYCVHTPILYFLAATVPYDRSSPLQVWTIFAVMLVAATGLGLLLEPRKREIYKFLTSLRTP